MSTLGLLTAFLGLASAMPVREPAIAEVQTNSTLVARQSSNWWLPNIDYGPNGEYANYAPGSLNDDNPPYYGGYDDYNYQVYLAASSVSDLTGSAGYIASQPDGYTRPNGYLSAEPRVIYLAPGYYELDQTLYMYTDTILVGDAVNPPTIAASSNFQGDQLIAGGVDQDQSGNGGELKFSTMIKNVILDTTNMAGTSDFTALSWRVAQNSALVNLVINLPYQAHTGITVGQGSTIQLGDTTINNGEIGLEWTGNQQGTVKNFVFNGCNTGFKISGGNTVNVFHPTFTSNRYPVIMGSGVGSWLSVIDATVSKSVIDNSDPASGVFFQSNQDYPNFMVENIRIDSAAKDVVQLNGQTLVGPSTYTPTYVYGNTAYADPIYQTGNSPQQINRPSALVTGDNDFYPVSSADAYASLTVDDVVNLKNPNQNGGYTIYGDNSHNDGPNLQAALNTAASQGKLAFLPFGVYLTEQTINIPIGTKLYGMGWPAISGTGSYFNDYNNPQPVVTLGNAGDVGSIDIQDVRFTVAETLAGAIIVQVNAAGNSPGDVAIHNSLITVGGTPDTDINCSNCNSAYIGLHLTSSSSAYIDNFWAWVADHSTDGYSADTNTQAKGGVLIEATKGTWLSGLGSEHWWLYNLNYNGASNVFMNLFQSETNYHQANSLDGGPQPRPNSPFPQTSSDPDFSWCNSGDATCYMTVAQYFSSQQSSNIFTYASGSWNIDGGVQDYMNAESSGPTNSYEYGLCAGATINGDQDHYVMIDANGNYFGSKEHYGGSWGSLVAQYVPNGN